MQSEPGLVWPLHWALRPLLTSEIEMAQAIGTATEAKQHTVTFILGRKGGKQSLCVFVENGDCTGVLQTFKLNASLDLAALESLIAAAKEAA
jgi:hypothetical protein